MTQSSVDTANTELQESDHIASQIQSLHEQSMNTILDIITDSIQQGWELIDPEYGGPSSLTSYVLSSPPDPTLLRYPSSIRQKVLNHLFLLPEDLWEELARVFKSYNVCTICLSKRIERQYQWTIREDGFTNIMFWSSMPNLLLRSMKKRPSTDVSPPIPFLIQCCSSCMKSFDLYTWLDELEAPIAQKNTD